MIKKISFSLIFLLWLLPEFLVFAQESKSGKLEGLAKADFLYKKGVNGLKTNPEECIILFKEAQFIYKNQGKNTEVVNCVLSLAELHIRLSDYDIAYGLLTNALSLSEEFELTSQHLRALNYLSKVCSYLNETERALGFISEGIKLAESKKEENSIEFFKGLRAYLLMYYKKEYTESNFMEILHFYRYCQNQKPDSILLISANNFLGGAYRLIKKDFEKSEVHYEESIRLSRLSGDLYQTSMVLNNLADMHRSTGQYKKAEDAAQQSLLLAKNMKSKLLMYNCYRLLSGLAEVQGNFNLALDYYKSFDSLKEKVLNEDLIRKTTEIHSLYQLEKKARENDKIKADRLFREKESEKKLRTYQMVALFFLVILLSFFVLFFLSRRSLAQSLRQKQTIQEQNEKLIALNSDLLLQRAAAEKANNEAALAVKSKIDFFSMVTHELRTPLNAVIGTVQLLHEENPLPYQKKSLEILQFSTENLLNLVNDILDFNRIEAGKIDLEKKPFSLEKLLKNIRNSLKFKAEEKGIELRLRIDKNLPNAFSGDKLRLGQIFYNLVSNAIKFTDYGFVEIEIRYYPGKTEGNIFASVRDTGIGIAQEKQQYIFEFFMQADTTIGRRFGGSGLGLTITKNLLSLMGSRIFLESKEGKGSNFFFSLYLPESESDLPEPGMEDSSESDSVLEGCKMLFVEDVDFNRVVAERFFRKWKIDFHTATNAMEALEMARKNSYDLILMDIQLPDLDGLRAAAEIRKNPRHRETPILAMTASPLAEVKEQLEQFGIQGYLPKPFVSQELKASLAHWLRISKNKV